ncbi:type II secretion system protein N [Alginatibacterium sediminis]|uniref:type II secretion system protein N n=1 Tax=Alginatibacterium sediminis TaxID=2164068 RepID=UPI001314E6C2|nr:type II secretion system protein N [Alginatibacterium sediminis]
MSKVLKPIVWACLLVSIAIWGFIKLLPVSAVLAWTPNSTPLAWKQAKGSLWEGSVKSLAYAGQELGPIHWQWLAGDLLKGRWAYHVQVGNGRLGGGEGIVAKSLYGWQLTDVNVYLPAQRLNDTVALMLPVSVDGLLELQIRLLDWTESCQQTITEFTWRGPQIASPLGVLEFENVVGQISCDQQQLSLEIKHNDSKLDLEAEILVSSSQWLSSGKLKAGAGLDKQYHDLLPYIGQADARGYYRFNDSGPLMW